MANPFGGVNKGSPIVWAPGDYSDVLIPRDQKIRVKGSCVTGDTEVVEEPKKAPPAAPHKPEKSEKPSAPEKGSRLLTTPTAKDFILARTAGPSHGFDDYADAGSKGFFYTAAAVLGLLIYNAAMGTQRAATFFVSVALQDDMI